MQYDVVIVGAGQGGSSAAIVLRQSGFAGSIVMIGREREIPYERPPLSKEYLLGDKPFEKLHIRPREFWYEQKIDLLQGVEVVTLDAATKTVTLNDGRDIRFADLIWAAGGDPRPLNCPGSELKGIHAVRDRADIDAIRAELDGVRRVAVVGGGYIGLEAASALRKLGKDVTLLEMLPRVLARVAGPPLSSFFEEEHRNHGVDLRTGIGVVAFEGAQRVVRMHLTDETTIDAQMVIVGIGIVPAVRPLLAAGAEGGNGVHVDEYCRTTLPSVYAVGDCAAHANKFAEGAVVRLESVQNATDQATCAAKAIAGAPQAYTATPWFWSNQYDLRLQTAGLSAFHDEIVLRGDPAKRSFAVAYLKAGRVVAFDCINNAKDYAQGRKLIEAFAHVPVAALADTSKPLKDLLQS